jgi:hypothetical protein
LKKIIHAKMKPAYKPTSPHPAILPEDRIRQQHPRQQRPSRWPARLPVSFAWHQARDKLVLPILLALRGGPDRGR